MSNFFNWANSELTQDGFIAWACDQYNQTKNMHLHDFAEAMINWFCGANTVQFNNVEVKMQEDKIDVLLILKDNGQIVRYVIIEDKTYSQIHDDQIVKYTDTLRKSAKVDLNMISIAYYKTGHYVQNSADFYYSANNGSGSRWFIGTKKSEKVAVNESSYELSTNCAQSYPQNTVNPQPIASFNTYLIDDIHVFFTGQQQNIKSASSEILTQYSKYVNDLYNDYDNLKTKPSTVGVTNNGWTKATYNGWMQLFDDFITNYGSNWPDLSMHAFNYSGKYIELLITSKNSSPSFPRTKKDVSLGSRVLNIRSNNIEIIHFLNKPAYNKLPNRFCIPNPQKKSLNKFCTYEIYHNQKGPKTINTAQDMIDLLTVVCGEFQIYINNPNLDFNP